MGKQKVPSTIELIKLIKTAMKECPKGNHDLVDIYSYSNGFGESEEVRWCRKCGSVVIDLEYDGRVQPGRIMTMESPQVSKLAQKL